METPSAFSWYGTARCPAAAAAFPAYRQPIYFEDLMNPWKSPACIPETPIICWWTATQTPTEDLYPFRLRCRHYPNDQPGHHHLFRRRFQRGANSSHTSRGFYSDTLRGLSRLRRDHQHHPSPYCLISIQADQTQPIIGRQCHQWHHTVWQFAFEWCDGT